MHMVASVCFSEPVREKARQTSTINIEDNIRHRVGLNNSLFQNIEN